MIVREYHPFSVVEDPEFKTLVHMLNPSYKLPTRKTVSSSLMQAIYNETVMTVKARLSRAFAVCLTMDGWTSRAQDNFIGVTAHYIADDNNRMSLESDLLTCVSYSERHTADNITKKLQEVLLDWELNNKVTAVVTDNAANMKAAVRGGQWRHWGCFAHTLNLVAQSGLKEMQTILDKVKAIVRLFKKSSHAYSQLKGTTARMQLPVTKLINDVPTRWNSTFDMLERILKMKDAVIATVAVVQSSGQVRDEVLTNIELLTNEERQAVQQTMEIMKVFQYITHAISGEKYVSASSVIVYVRQLHKHLNAYKFDDLTPSAQRLVLKLLNELNVRFKDLEKNELIAQATILDPRIKNYGFINKKNYDEALQALYRKVANTVIQNEIDFETSTNEQQNQSSNVQREETTSLLTEGEKFIWDSIDTVAQNYIRPRYE
ncbi:zinc finger BED domain-containing protein 1-like [Rhagoletis pomonella]|uniref:zinc finger BED domain-containing protein 1-like n=1 Tax=Rhagoletis pomonella TaxID=28610 RepID=UPI0017872660|nr:zinc finger BED domain-containing protein 1-like [Rhagoletis pomonella]